MPTIYITDETKEKLDRLVKSEKRTISTQVDFLCDQRLQKLNIHENANPSVENSEKPTPKGVEMQEESQNGQNAEVA